MSKLFAVLIAAMFATGVAVAQDKKADDKKPAAEAKKDAKPAAAPAKKEEPKK